MADFDMNSFLGNSTHSNVGLDLGLEDIFDNNLDEFFTENPMNSIVDNDPFLSNFSCQSNNNVLDIVDLPQKFMDHGQTQTSPCEVTESSPWHESDSGISETISVSGSPEHYIYDQNSHHDTGNSVNLTMHRPNSEEELDRELAAYLQNDCEMPSPSKSSADSDDLSFFAHSLDKEEFDLGDLVDVDKEPLDLVDVVSSSNFQPINKTSNIEQNTNKILDDFKSSSKHSRPSEVKILKVVRPSNNSTGVTSEDIAKAMEERSKKNAAQAKQNREKKKAYIQSLECELDELKSSNKNFQAENAKMKKELDDRDEEIAYLKSVLVNSSSLSSLLKNITDVKEVKLSASIMSRKRSAKEDHSYNLVENAPQKRARLVNENLKKAGVCLHVMGGSACLEFCAHCSKLARESHAHS